MINRMFPSLKNQWGIQQVEEKNYFVYKNKSLVWNLIGILSELFISLLQSSGRQSIQTFGIWSLLRRKQMRIINDFQGLN